MTSPLKSLTSDDIRYQKSFKLFLERSTEYQQLQKFIANQLPDILASIVNDKSHLNIIGVGSGPGEIDIKILSMLHVMNPQIMVNNEVVEPNLQLLGVYRDLVSQTPGLDYIKCNWNNMTAEEFEEQWKEKKMTKKADLIHMFQMLYYVKDRDATISFFQSLLNKNGKLLISLVTGESGWGKLAKTYSKQLCNSEVKASIESIKMYLDSKGVSYRSYLVPSQMDITECFTEGDEVGELMLDFLTEVLHFSKSASPELKAGLMKFLRLDCSVESNGRVMFNSDYEVIVVNKLT